MGESFCFQTHPVWMWMEAELFFTSPLWVSGFLLYVEGTRKDGRATRGKKVSGGHFFSPWESPSASRRIRYGCGWRQNCFSHRLFGYLVFCFMRKGLERTAEQREAKKCPVDTFLVRGRVLLLPDASGTDVDGSRTLFHIASLGIWFFALYGRTKTQTRLFRRTISLWNHGHMVP